MADGQKAGDGPADALYVALGARVAALRAERGEVTHHPLAARAGMDPNYVWRIEAGRQNLGLRNVARLARALDLTMSQLLHGIDIDDVPLRSRGYAKRDRNDSVEGQG